MIKKFTLNPKEFFKELAKTNKSQATTMVLAPQKSTGGPINKHPNSDQWLYVIKGQATVIVEGKSISIQQGDLLLIEANKTHEVINPGQNELKILNIYTPPAY